MNKMVWLNVTYVVMLGDSPYTPKGSLVQNTSNSVNKSVFSY